MKVITLLAAIFYCLSASAQRSNVPKQPPVTYQCGIYFDYDAAGNRVKRYYDCKDVSTPSSPGPVNNSKRYNPSDSATDAAISDASSLEYSARIFPNPNDGHFTIQTSWTADTHYHIYGEDGRIVTSGTIREGVSVVDISKLAAANYILAIYQKDKVYRFQIAKSE